MAPQQLLHHQHAWHVAEWVKIYFYFQLSLHFSVSTLKLPRNRPSINFLSLSFDVSGASAYSFLSVYCIKEKMPKNIQPIPYTHVSKGNLIMFFLSFQILMNVRKILVVRSAPTSMAHISATVAKATTWKRTDTLVKVFTIKVIR